MSRRVCAFAVTTALLTLAMIAVGNSNQREPPYTLTPPTYHVTEFSRLTVWRRDVEVCRLGVRGWTKGLPRLCDSWLEDRIVVHPREWVNRKVDLGL